VLWRDSDRAPHPGQKVGCRLCTETVQACSPRSTLTTFKPAAGDHAINVFIAPRCRIPSQRASPPAHHQERRTHAACTKSQSDPPDVRLDDHARACVGRRGKGGQEGQALGRSRGGFTTKIHAKSDASGDIIAFDLTGGEASYARHFDVLLDIGPDIQPRAVICDKGYASKANREAARARGIAPVIPHKANQRDKPVFSREPSIRRARASNRPADASNALRCVAKRPLETSDQSSASPPAYA
jgi:hypothetical protein